MEAVATPDGDSFAVTPVPAPATLPLILAGPGIMGLIARLRPTA